MSLQQLRCFCAAAQLGSFTAAADQLRVSQPAVAEQIRKLERTLGADLFVRAGRGVVPTDAGQAFAEHAIRTLRSLEDAADSVGAYRSLDDGVATPGHVQRPRRPGVSTSSCPRSSRRHPAMTVRLVGRNSAWTAERVRQGELEAGIVVLPIDDDRLDVRPLVRDEVLYVSADAGSARARRSRCEQLASAPLIFYDAESADNDPIRRQLADRAQADGLRLRPRVEVEFMDLALRLVAAGVGDTYLPSAYTHAPYFPAQLTTTTFDSAAPRHVRRRHAPGRPPLRRYARADRRARDAHAGRGRGPRSDALTRINRRSIRRRRGWRRR